MLRDLECCMEETFLDSQWWNKHSHVVIDAKGQNKNRHFLHLEELMCRGCSKTVFHKQETVEEMMNQKSNEKPAATTETVGKPPIILLLWTRKTTSLEVLEMPCGEHDNASIANLLANFLKKHGLKKTFHPLLHCENNKEWEGRLCLNQNLCVMVEICDNDCRFRVMGHEIRTSEKTENDWYR